MVCWWQTMTPLEGLAWFVTGLGLILSGVAIAVWFQNH